MNFWGVPNSKGSRNRRKEKDTEGIQAEGSEKSLTKFTCFNFKVGKFPFKFNFISMQVNNAFAHTEAQK